MKNMRILAFLAALVLTVSVTATTGSTKEPQYGVPEDKYFIVDIETGKLDAIVCEVVI